MNTQSVACEPVHQHISSDDTIRIMKVVTGFCTGGTELQVLNLARGLDRQQFDLSFACLEKEGNLLAEYEALQAAIAEFGIKKLYHPQCFLQQYRLAALLRKQRTQIMHSYNFYSNVFAIPAARLAGVPVVLASVRDRGVYLSSAQKQLQRRVLGLADRILVNADSIRDWLAGQGLKEDRISVIRNGIDLSRYPDDPAPSDVRREWGIPESSPIVILLARLDPKKGIEDFIRAVGIIAEKHPTARFLIVGATMDVTDGVVSEVDSYRDQMLALVESLDLTEQVIFTRHRDDTPDLLAESTISVLPSLSEGLSNTLLESMAAGVATIATDVGGNPELVKDGVNGKLVPVKSPEHLARAMDSLLSDPELCQKLGMQGRVMAREGYSLPGAVERIQQLYRDQLRQAKRTLA